MPKFNRIDMKVNFQLPVRREQFEGKEHLVAPVVALVEGVHAGSGGALYYPADEIAKYTDAWNGIPLPVFHPEDSTGPVSANTPQLIEQKSVGRLFNVRFDEDKNGLVGEVWVDVEKAKKIAPAILEMIEGGRQLEVSTALFTDGDGTPGRWRDEDYEETVINYRPDHLALLPGAKGACSWEDGCGLRANEKRDDDKGLFNRITSAFKTMASALSLKVQEVSHEDLRSKLQSAIDSLDNPGWTHYVRDVYDDYFVYEAHGNNPNEIGDAESVSKLYKRDYSVNEDGEVSIAENAEEVKEVREYVPIDNAAEDKDDDDKTLSKEEMKMNRDELIKALIECPHNGLAANDEEWLKDLPDDRLQAMRYVEAKKEPETNEEPDGGQAKEQPETNDEKSEETEPKANEPETVDGYIAKAPPEMQDTFKRAIALHRKAKDDLVKGLMANKRNKFTEEQLRGKDIDELETLAELGQVEVDYSLQGGGPVSNEDDDSPPEPTPVFNLDEKQDMIGKQKEKKTA